MTSLATRHSWTWARVAQGQARGLVGGGARRGAAHGEVHRSDVHGPRHGCQRSRQPIMHDSK
jgi:hypothetical protein